MSNLVRSQVFRLAQAQSSIPGPAGERSTLVLKRGTCDVKLALPIPPNEQAPHTQDEIYVIVRGRGVLLHDGKRDSFETGDLCSSPRESSTDSKPLVKTLRYGAFSMVLKMVRCHRTLQGVL